MINVLLQPSKQFHTTVLLYDSCHVEPQRFSIILSPKQKKNKKIEETA